MSSLRTEAITMNAHQSGVTPETYSSNANLKKFFNVISTNSDRAGRAFVSTVEAKDTCLRRSVSP